MFIDRQMRSPSLTYYSSFKQQKFSILCVWEFGLGEITLKEEGGEEGKVAPIDG